MSSQEPVEQESAANWPTFSLRYTFNPEELEVPVTFEPDELVVFDPTTDDEAWLSADRGAYLDIQDAR